MIFMSYLLHTFILSLSKYNQIIALLQKFYNKKFSDDKNFTSAMVHELRNPLFSVMGSLELIQANVDSLP